MNKMYPRMKELLENSSISFEQGGLSDAEIYAYSSALALVSDHIGATLDKIFISRDGADNLSAYLRLLCIRQGDMSVAQLKERIFRRMAMSFGEYTQDIFDSELALTGVGEYTIDGNTITFGDFDASCFSALGDFIKAYVYAGCNTRADGNGLTFDEWDLWGQPFRVYDSFNLPFSILESIRRDIIE